MPLTLNQIAKGAVPTSETDAHSAVPSGKTWMENFASFQNQSGAARTINIKLIDTDGTTVLQHVTEDIPTGGTNWPVVLDWPVEASQKVRWQASGASVYGLIKGVKN